MKKLTSKYFSSSPARGRSSGADGTPPKPSPNRRRLDQVPERFSPPLGLAHATTASTGLSVALTPLEVQVADIKKQYPDFLLFVESGYRFRFFDQDALTAAECLSIIAHRHRGRMVASIPTFRVLVHAKTLLSRGHKLAIVRQSETALSRKRKRAACPPGAKTFERAVAALFTPGSGISEDHPSISDLLHRRDPCDDSNPIVAEGERGDDQLTPSLGHRCFNPNWIVSIYESTSENIQSSPDEASRGASSFGLVAVSLELQQLRHRIVENDVNTMKLLDALRIIEPSELVVTSSVRKPTLHSLKKQCPNALITVADSPTTDRDLIFGELICGVDTPIPLSNNSGRLSGLSEVEMQSLGQLSGHLQLLSVPSVGGSSYCNVLHIMEIQGWTGDIRPSSGAGESTSFEVDGATARDLNLFRDSVQHEERLRDTAPRTTCLFDLINHCRTSFGERRLFSWMMNPLTNVKEINRRQDAIQWLSGPVDSDLRDVWLSQILAVLNRASISAQTVATLRNRAVLCSPRRVCNLLTFGKSLEQLSVVSQALAKVATQNSTMIPELVHVPIPYESIDTVASHSETFLQCIDTNSIEKNGEIAFSLRYRMSNGDLLAVLDEKIRILKRQLQDFLQLSRRNLEAPQMSFKSLAFRTTCTEPYNDYLIEVDATDVELRSRLPKDWLLVSSTKKLHRYHAPEIVDTIAKLREVEDDLEVHLKELWRVFLSTCLGSILPHFDLIFRYLSDIDALLSLGKLGAMSGYVRPRYTDKADEVLMSGARHPVVEQILRETSLGASYIPNDVHLRCNFGKERMQLVSGPNMGGKSCYASMIALVCLLGQMGAHVPAESATMCALDRICTVLCGNSLRNEILCTPGLSSFALEMQRLSETLKVCTSHSLVVIDELGRGTSANEGSCIAIATVKYLLQHVGCACIFISHYLKCFRRYADSHTGDNGTANFHVNYVLQGPSTSSTSTEADETTPGAEVQVQEGAISSAEEFSESRITYLYQIVPGCAPNSYGLYAARAAGLDVQILEHALKISQVLDGAPCGGSN